MIKFLKTENIKNNKALTIFSVFFVLVFISLGFWQIERASEKLNLIKNFEIQQSSQPQYIQKTQPSGAESLLKVFMIHLNRY